MEVFKPRAAGSIRPPTSDKQKHGVVVNTPRFAHLGGLSNAGKVGKTGMAVSKPADGKKVL